MMRPHILIIPPWFDLDFQHHFSKSYHRWADDLANREEAEVGLLYGAFNSGFRRHRMYGQQELNYRYLGVSGWGLPKAGPGWIVWKRHYLRAFLEYVRLYGKPTVIHGFSLLGVIAARMIGQAHRIPHVYTEVLGSFLTGKTSGRLIRQAADGVREASLVCGISPVMVEALEETYGVEARLISLYVDSELFSPMPFPEGPPRFLSIGSPAYTKGLDVLVKAMRFVVQAHPEARLTIVAEPRDEEDLKSWIMQQGIERSVDIHGPVAHRAIPPLIHQCHVLVSASRTESLGFTMIEALASGRPVVASATPGAQFIVSANSGELVPLDGPDGCADPRELATAMVAVHDRRNQYSHQRLRDEVLTKFGKKKVLDEWMGHYFRISKQGIG